MNKQTVKLTVWRNPVPPKTTLKTQLEALNKKLERWDSLASKKLDEYISARERSSKIREQLNMLYDNSKIFEKM